ncbi:DUF3891 family protein [Pseudobacillus sp. FSL P4-0506]|uniref:DUF3891 family protein n=1 Tax=unclassified Pseudobacillus TaxID=2619284 RepID=UPI0030F6FF18
MIVRERKNEFVLIEQDHHAQISGIIMSYWKDSLFSAPEFRRSVEYAIFQHDCGWKPFDTDPFWNDKKEAPYTFVDFPVLPKLVLYKQGIDEVEKNDHYAALLCSMHYSAFLRNEALDEVKPFQINEEQRRERLIASLKIPDPSLPDSHYRLLQLGDNLSLYICLNEPGTTKEQEHPFFCKGIPLSAAFNKIEKDNIQLYWQDKQTIAMDPFPFRDKILITLKQKTLSKDQIASQGFLESYKKTSFCETPIQLMPSYK